MKLFIQTSFLIILSLLVLPIGANAQLKCKIEHYSTEDGLSHDAVNCMIKDSEGFMWFGTWDGINRFDGHSFVSYKSSPGDMSQLKNDRIDQIVEDRSNHLWLRAYDNQIYRFDKKTQQFLPISTIINRTGKKKISFERIFETTNGDIWLTSTHDGLFYFPNGDTSLHHYINYAKGVSSHEIPSGKPGYLHEDTEHNIWVPTSDGLGVLTVTAAGVYQSVTLPRPVAKGLNFTIIAEDARQLYFGATQGELVIYNKLSKQFLFQKITSNQLNGLIVSKLNRCIYATTSAGEVLTVSIDHPQIITLVKSNQAALYSIYEDRSGYLWIAPDKQGALRYSPFNKSFQYFSQKNDAKNTVGVPFHVFEDNAGIVWIKMKTGGFGFYNPVKGVIDYFYNEPGTPGRQLSNVVTDLYYDKTGVLWLNTDDKGIDKIIFQRDDFNQKLLVDPAFFKTDNEVRGVLCDHKGRLWLGVKSGKLYIYQNGKLLTDLFVNEPAGGFGLVYALMEDHLGNIWLGTKANGLFKAVPVDGNRTKYRISHYLSDKNDVNSLSSDEIYTLLEDQQGRVWIGTYDEGLNLVAGEGSSLKFIHNGNIFSHYPKGAFQKIRHMALDKSGKMWIATTDGLLIQDAGSDHSTVFRYVTYGKIPGDKESLGNNDIQFIYRDQSNRMWLATSGGGLDCAIGDQPFEALKFKDYTTKDGLPNDYIISCTEDRRGNLWVATQNGLSRFNLKERQFRNYDSYDGLPKTTFSEASCGSLPDGTLIFGTVKGYLSFDPDKITNDKVRANMAFTNLQVNNEDIGSADSGILKYNINYASGLTLRYNQNIISIDYAVLDQRSGNKQAYAYRLKGFDATWQNNKNQRRATYTNLPPGNYVFEVKSLRADLYDNLPYRDLTIKILPPPWRTWWAYLLYALIICIVAEIIRRIALTVLRLRHNIAVEKRLTELKLSFFTNISHELRTPLSLILNPIEEIYKKEKLSDLGNEYIGVVRQNANRMVRFINQLLDLRKVQNGKATLKISQVEIVSFVKEIGKYFGDVAREKNIKLNITSDRKEVIAWIDAEKLDIVIYNVLANAFKFSPPDKNINILINTTLVKNRFLIQVIDEGEGVADGQLTDIFELYYEGNQSTGKNLKGTGIGLALSKEFVELHHGEISAKNNPEHGLMVTVSLLFGKEHFLGDEVVFVDLPDISHDLMQTMEGVVPQLHNTVIEPLEPGAPVVLLVEDNTDLRLFLNIQLSEFYRVEMAENGEEGLKKALALIPDLILTDVMMPKMDGIEMLDRLKNDPLTSHIPVAVLSAKFSVENQIRGLRYGADYYITKPFNNEFLLASISNLLQQRKKIFEKLTVHKTVISLEPKEVEITSYDEQFLKRIIEIVENKIADPDFNIDDVADSLSMSRSPFYKKFKSLTNLAPVEFVREMRLKRAKQYFDAGETNIAKVAICVGFSTPKYFSTCFKEYYQVSPSDYLKVKL